MAHAALALPIRTTSGVLAGAADASVHRICGFSIRCTTKFSINIRSGSATGTIIAAIDVPDATALGDSFASPPGCDGPVYIEVLAAGTGAVGSIWIE